MMRTRLTSLANPQHARLALCKRLNPLLRRLGFTLLADHFYQPVPNRTEWAATENRSRAIQRIDRGLAQQGAQADALLRAVEDELASLLDGPWPIDFTTSQVNQSDASLAYALIRQLRPKSVIEVGAGGSTRALLAALARNETPCSFTSIDPYPARGASEAIGSAPSTIAAELWERRLQDVDPAALEALGRGDVLFIDSSHVFKPGSDVEYLFTRLLPRLRPGTWIHVHDIFYPFDYPQEWNQRLSRFWNEQYFLEAIMANSDRYEARYAVNQLTQAAPDLQALIERQLGPERVPSASFWMQVTDRLGTTG